MEDERRQKDEREEYVRKCKENAPKLEQEIDSFESRHWTHSGPLLPVVIAYVTCS